MRAAKIIMGDDLYITTTCGIKTVDDLADLIDEKTQASALLAALKALYENCTMIHTRWGDDSNQEEADAAIAAGRVAIARAEGEG
jgi:hypothetical protein